MKHTGRFSLLALGIVLAAAGAHADSVNIPQVPGDSTPINNSEAGIKVENNNNGDYQNQILNNPEYNDKARADSIEASGGNTATIIQDGGSNKSVVIQKGSHNHAYQRQHGHHNDLRVEQYGKHNTSREDQEGDYNHKVKIQNGKVEEDTTTIEQAAPSQGTNP